MEQKKFCPRCQKYFFVSEFNKNSSRKDGLSGNCKKCSRAYIQDHYGRNRQYYIDKAKRHSEIQRAWFKDIKSGLKCIICGESRIPCLHFHHRDSDVKERALSRAISNGWSREKLVREMQKCDVLCANCHACYHAGILDYIPTVK